MNGGKITYSLGDAARAGSDEAPDGIRRLPLNVQYRES